MQKKLIIKLVPQLLAIVVLILIELAVLREALLVHGSVTWVDWIAWGLALVLLVQAVEQAIGEIRQAEVRPGNVWIGGALLVVGWGIFFFEPEFFNRVLAVQQRYYFATVSWYSLPAVLVEGGLFSVLGWLLVRYREHLQMVTWVEKLAPWLLGLYVVAAIGTNFFAIHEVVTVDTHLLVSRVASTVMLLFWVVAVAWMRLKQKKLGPEA